MSESLKAKQYIPVTEDELQMLKNEATKRGIGAGLFARVMFSYGLAHLDGEDLDRRASEEKAASKQRVSAGARVAVRARWQTNSQDGK